MGYLDRPRRFTPNKYTVWVCSVPGSVRSLLNYFWCIYLRKQRMTQVRLVINQGNRWVFFESFCLFVLIDTSFWIGLKTMRLIAKVKTKVNPLHPNVSMHILQTLLYTFPLVLTRRIRVKVKASQVNDHFLNSHDHNKWFNSIYVRRNEMLVTLRV